MDSRACHIKSIRNPVLNIGDGSNIARAEPFVSPERDKLRLILWRGRRWRMGSEARVFKPPSHLSIWSGEVKKVPPSAGHRSVTPALICPFPGRAPEQMPVHSWCLPVNAGPRKSRPRQARRKGSRFPTVGSGACPIDGPGAPDVCAAVSTSAADNRGGDPDQESTCLCGLGYRFCHMSREYAVRNAQEVPLWEPYRILPRPYGSSGSNGDDAGRSRASSSDSLRRTAVGGPSRTAINPEDIWLPPGQ